MDLRLFEQMSELEDEHWWFLAKRQIVRLAIEKHARDIDNSASILDAGCGTGGNLKYFSGLFKNLKGMELEETARELAKQKTGAEIKYGKFPDEIPFYDEEFDVVLMLDVLEHLDDDVSALKNIRQKIKKGKYIAVTVPAFNFLWSRHDDIHHHKRRYTLIELKDKLNNSGFEVVYGSYFYFFLFPLIALYKILNNKNEDNLKPTADFINKFLLNIMELEALLMSVLRLPWGSSVVMLARNHSHT